MAEKISFEQSNAMFYRKFIDVQSSLSSAMTVWNERATRAGVRIDQISPSELNRVWTSPDCLCQIMNYFVADAIDSSVRGDRVEVELRLDEDSADWLTLVVRDWAGGRPDSWSIPSLIQHLAKQVDGYIDVSNHAGRSTVCSLHIPTGKLQGWLRRQAATMWIHHIAWSSLSAGPSSHDGFGTSVEDALQMALSEFGSFVPLGEKAFLWAASNAIDEAVVRASFSKALRNHTTFSDSIEDISVRCDCLGRISDFLHRIEKSLTATVEPASEPKGSQERHPKPTHRIDRPGLTPTPLSDRAPQTSGTRRSPGNRIRPRRVNVISD